MDPVLYKTDDGNFVRFEETTARNEAASAEAGRPIFDKVLLATVLVPGSRQEAVHEIERSFVDGSVRRRDATAQRFEKQLAAFRASHASRDLTGTPVEQWPSLDVRQIAELRALGVFTVEALAALSDAGLQRLGPGGRVLQDKAVAWLEAAKGSAHAEHLAVELARRDAEIARLSGQVAELAALLEERTRPDRSGSATAIQEA